MSGSTVVIVRGPLAPYADEFRRELTDDGYTSLSAVELVRLLAHVSRWLEAREIEPGGFTDAAALVFLADRRSEGHTHRLTVRSMGPLMRFLRDRNVVPPPEVPFEQSTVEAVVLRDYHDFLVTERGLVPAVVAQFDQVAQKFVDRVAGDGFAASGLVAADVTGYFATSCVGSGPATSRNLAAGLRSFLRFLHVSGRVDRPLAQAIPPVASRKNSSLPMGVSTEFVAALLAGCDRDRGIGLRDYAILVVLSRLALRSAEVSGLTLDDIEWRVGELVIRGKGSRVERLPLPVDVGDAIATYLQHGRPRTKSREVFIRAIAPPVALASNAVSWVTYSACDRAGLPRVSAHRLRHSAACEMLATGSTLGEVSQVLRHSRLATTAIYAKVDYARLTELVRPWPGGEA